MNQIKSNLLNNLGPESFLQVAKTLKNDKTNRYVDCSLQTIKLRKCQRYINLLLYRNSLKRL